ncbi:hypothetical protein KFE94_10570 [bacterium SCSIO 12643]|nr:hypothetical protein KFE94_10570 [bacterium SCSIO 12643]
MTVDYKTTKGSYHQLSGKRNKLVILSRMSGADFTMTQLMFLGLSSQKESLKNLSNNESITIGPESTFENGININEKICSFTFNQKIGITEYVDCEGNMWIRQIKE